MEPRALLGTASIAKRVCRAADIGPRLARQQELFDAASVLCALTTARQQAAHQEENMHGLIYLIGLIVVIMAILSFFGLR